MSGRRKRSPGQGSDPAHAKVQPNHQPAPGPIGNATGMIIPDTAPNPHGNSQPDIRTESREEKSFLDRALEALDIPALQDLQAGALNKIDGLVEGSGYSVPAMVLGSISKAVVEVFMPTNVIDVVPGGKAARLAKKGADATGAAKKGAKKAEGTGGGKDKGPPKKKLKCAQDGSYSDLKTQSGDGKFDRDHIPSKAALHERARQLNNGKALTSAQKKAITDWGNAIAIPREAHQQYSPTYGGRNDPVADAKDLASSAKRDVDTMLDHIGEYDADGGCKKAYKKASKKITDMTNEDYARELKKILKSK